MPHRIFDTNPSIQLATYLAGIFGWIASRTVHLAQSAGPGAGSVTDMASGGSIAVITSGVVMSLIQLARYVAELKAKNAEADRQERKEVRDHDLRLADAEARITKAHALARKTAEEYKSYKDEAARKIDQAKAEATSLVELAKRESDRKVEEMASQVAAEDKEKRHKLRGEFAAQIMDLQAQLIEARNHRDQIARQVGVIDHRDVVGINRNIDHIARVAEAVDPGLDVEAPHVRPVSGPDEDGPAISDNGG